MLELVKGPVDLNSPAQLNAPPDHVLEAHLCIILRQVQHQSILDVVSVIHTGELRDASPTHHGEEVDDEVCVSAQDHEGSAAEVTILLKVLAVLMSKEVEKQRIMIE